MSEEIEFLKLVAQRLNDAGFSYMLSGSMALNYYAQPRMTRDIDFVVDLPVADAARFAALFARDCYVDAQSVRDAALSTDMFNIIHNEWIIKADFIVRKRSPYRMEEFNRRREVFVDESKLFIVAPEDLLLSKLAWSKSSQSEMQRRDVQNLVASFDGLDWVYLEKWAQELGVSDLLRDTKATK